MTKVVKALIASSLFLSLSVQAAVNVKMGRDVEALVVDGNQLPITVMTKNKFTLENGQNQLVVRVSKLVSKGSEFEKFKSEPVVLTFTANDTDITIEPTRIITREHEVKDFKGNPSFKLLSSSGSELFATQYVLPRGPGLVRDYERELEKYNKHAGLNHSKAEAQDAATLDVQSKQTKVTQAQASQVRPKDISSENNIILLQADFLRMAPEDQKKFLQWAVKNVRS